MLNWLSQLFGAAAQSRRLVFTALTISFLLHVPFSFVPPRWTHNWRQCNTLAVARNFYQEDMDILRPRVDRRLDQSGVTGMQFPAYEYLVALGYQVFGESHAVERLVQWTCFSVGVLSFHAWLLLIGLPALAASLGAWAFCFSPDLFYFGFSALPDVLALSASLLGLVTFIRWFENGDSRWFWVSLTAVTLAGLTKLQFLAVGFPILAFVLGRRRSVREPVKIAMLAFYAMLAVAVSLGWYAYASELIRSSGLHDFGIRFHGAGSLSEGLHTVFHNWTSEIPETSLGYPSALFLVLALVWWKKGSLWASSWRWPLAAWALALTAYYFIELGQMKDHSYYLFPLLPLLFLCVALGASRLWQRQSSVAVVLLLLLPLLSAIRMLPRWSRFDQGLPAEFQDTVALQRLIDAAPAGTPSIVGPDDSGCIYLYYLRKKGWGYADARDLESQIDSAVQRGARVLYTDNALLLASTKIQKHLGQLRLQVGHFQVWTLRDAKP